jgi:hypothetical protein
MELNLDEKYLAEQVTQKSIDDFLESFRKQPWKIRYII